ncbi:Predicted metal-binding protein [Desulfocicer vacuolatum DSM 3385]|uniref:Predicted metal-binding protein n=1 Tax=Desulfocicer vacuolatum DSM 3385 TaxID=1121400 RepID=A0A1W2AZ74_9BACT|nr:DUF2284 domain-containing protein [Desulfocicer vacuolatum]SMC66047.1 Predicted metal-binding protein [Desulfocicer vacuolatum DSM 3385]
MTCLDFQNSDPTHKNFQYLEDLATAYWYSEVLFASLELNLFEHLDKEGVTIDGLSHVADCHGDALFRLLRALEKMALVARYGDVWFNTSLASFCLVPGKETYMGDFFLYRRYMQPNWSRLACRVSRKERLSRDCDDSAALEKISNKDYRARNLRYVTAMDTLVKEKARNIAQILKSEPLKGPFLDVGGGAGSMLRALLPLIPQCNAVLFELPEVIEAAHELYPETSDWNCIETMEGDFRSHSFDEKFGVVMLSNFLHAYGPQEARELLEKAISLLSDHGVILIHDYFPDRAGKNPEKGALYDLTMMLNTYNGCCHEARDIARWLKSGGMTPCEIIDLDTDTSLMVAGGSGKAGDPLKAWINIARNHGFERAVGISPDTVVTAPWVRKKCQWGCDGFGKNLQCPPRGMSHKETREMIDSYETLILLEGTPPGKAFHEKLLALEKTAFMAGFHKAFVFGAGPCTLCPRCSDDDTCRHHDLARPAMEASGIDVYETAARAGVRLKPVQKKMDYVKYMGLLLLK